MRHRKAKKTLDRKKSARAALFRSLAVNLILAQRMHTTEAKAKALRPFIERLVTRAKKNTPSAHRFIRMQLHHRAASEKLISTIAPSVGNRKGGYTRIVKMIPRHGDGARMALITFVDDKK